MQHHNRVATSRWLTAFTMNYLSLLSRRTSSSIYTSPLVWQSRCYWQEIVRVLPDPKTGKPKYERPHEAGMRAVRGMGNDGDKRRRKLWERRFYEKPWMKRQRLKDKRIYGRKKRQVVELTKYVHFVRDYKKNQREEKEKE